jgi:hypothetical protein
VVKTGSYLKVAQKAIDDATEVVIDKDGKPKKKINPWLIGLLAAAAAGAGGYGASKYWNPKEEVKYRKPAPIFPGDLQNRI